MITYEMAKQLKDAGFPQATGGFYYWNGELVEARDMRSFYDEKIVTHTIKIPTLSELIKECGVMELVVYIDYAQARSNGKETEGSTPEEAVAKLYLQLKKLSPTKF